MLYPKLPFSIAFNPNFKDTLLFDVEYVEYLITIQDWHKVIQTSNEKWYVAYMDCADASDYDRPVHSKGGAMAHMPPPSLNTSMYWYK